MSNRARFKYGALRGTARDLFLRVRDSRGYRGTVRGLSLAIGAPESRVWGALVTLCERGLLKAQAAADGRVLVTVTDVGNRVRA